LLVYGLTRTEFDRAFKDFKREFDSPVRSPSQRIPMSDEVIDRMSLVQDGTTWLRPDAVLSLIPIGIQPLFGWVTEESVRAKIIEGRLYISLADVALAASRAGF
jgi:hypothetical protein